MTGSHLLMGLATLGGMGRAPLAGGTVATLVAGVPMALLVSHLHGALSLAVLGIVCVLGALGADRVIVEMGREDPGEVVVDELAGYLLTMFWLPATWTNLAAGFVLFRLLDIWKPWPIRWVDATVKGGWGAMLDDLLAGAMAHAILRLLSAATG